MICLTYWFSIRSDGGYGITTKVAALLVFSRGAAAVLGKMAPAAAVAVVTTALLATKTPLHGGVCSI